MMGTFLCNMNVIFIGKFSENIFLSIEKEHLSNALQFLI